MLEKRCDGKKERVVRSSVVGTVWVRAIWMVLCEEERKNYEEREWAEEIKGSGSGKNVRELLKKR